MHTSLCIPYTTIAFLPGVSAYKKRAYLFTTGFGDDKVSKAVMSIEAAKTPGAPQPMGAPGQPLPMPVPGTVSLLSQPGLPVMPVGTPMMHGVSGQEHVGLFVTPQSPEQIMMEQLKHRWSGPQQTVEIPRETKTDPAGIGLFFKRDFSGLGPWVIYDLAPVRCGRLCAIYSA